MRRRQLAGIILASALITLDGTATTVALPVIGRELSTSVTRLQWISNAPLLIMAALLLPAGALADRYGRVRTMRLGLIGVIGASVASAAAWSDLALIGAKFVQGAGGALVLPAALALLRGEYTDAAERTRVFGVWAAWTGVAAAVGPLLAGALVDVWSWRAVFLVIAAAGLAGVLLLEADRPAPSSTTPHPIPVAATLALMVLFGGLAYLLMESASTELTGRGLLLPGALAIGASAFVAAHPSRHVLVPRALLTSRNCVSANAATFALYFGMFGLSFLVVLYTQQLLDYSALRAAFVLLPVSIMLFFAEPFGRLTARLGTRLLIASGALCAAAGIGWMAAGNHPLSFWSHILVGTSLFGLGISLSVSALTHAAVAAVPDTCAGAASGLNHAVVRAGGLVAIALLGSVAAPGVTDTVSPEGFQRAMLIGAVVVFAGGAAGAALMRDEEPGGLEPKPDAEGGS